MLLITNFNSRSARSPLVLLCSRRGPDFSSPKVYPVPEVRGDGIKVSDINDIDCDRDSLAALIHRIETNPTIASTAS